MTNFPRRPTVAVIGLGYVGLTLAVSLAARGMRVLGIERRDHVRACLARRTLPFFEPGIADALRSLDADALSVAAEMPADLPDVVVVSVGTPTGPDHRVDLSQLRAAIDDLAPHLGTDTLVVLRSTVPVGTCRRIVAPRLARFVTAPRLAFCPERTIQGRALEELRTLPQVVGAIDVGSAEQAAHLFSRLTSTIVPVSSLEAAEAVKLLCNTHTDLIYGFGNQVAIFAEETGLDAHELVDAANRGYPRPRLHGPGFVGGSCLVKDPYLFAASLDGRSWQPELSLAARRLNESVPDRVADRVVRTLKELDTPLDTAKVLVCGLTYKGRPETDDTRGAAAPAVIEHLRGLVGSIVVHDPVVGARGAEPLGVPWVPLGAGFTDADAVIVLTDHDRYHDLELTRLLRQMRRPAVVSDVWGVLDEHAVHAAGATYLRLGRASSEAVTHG